MSQQLPQKKILHHSKVRLLSRGRPPSNVKITNSKTTKLPPQPLGPEATKKKEEDKLRTQLSKEIASRARSCSHKSYDCLLPVVSGRQYCAKHILADSSTSYRQCTHVYTGGDRCQLAAPQEREGRELGLCYVHARAAAHSRQRSVAPPPPVTTTETLLTHLNHYVRVERTRTASCASAVSVVSEPADQETLVPQSVDPFKEINAIQVNNAYSSSLMECNSASDSDADSVTLGPEGNVRVYKDSSTDDELESEEQPLWRAGVYTAEEAISEARNSLKLLQSAYKRQMNRLRILLQMSRKQYLDTIKVEKEQYCSINAQARGGPLTVRERRQLRKLKAYASYHRKHGMDAVLARKLQHKRAKVNDTANRPIPSQGRCTFSEGGVRCSLHVLPAAKHCLKHVLCDRYQVLFYPCGDERAGVTCLEPVPRLPLASAACRYHTDPPLYSVFTLKKDETETCSAESEVTTDNVSEAEEPDEFTEKPSLMDHSYQ